MKCPGQDSRFWKEDAIYEFNCPECGRDVEFFKDDTSRKCPHCGHHFPNPKMDFGCAAYCQYAEQCLGTLPEEIKQKQQDLVKDKVGMEVRKYLKGDTKRIQKANTLAGYAEQIGKKEGADLGIVIMAAYLHSLTDPKNANNERNPSLSNQNSEKQDIARQILEKFQVKEDIIRQVCSILDPDRPADDSEKLNFNVLFDAILVTELEKNQSEYPGDEGHSSLNGYRNLATESAKNLASKIVKKQ